ncbi:MAG: nucleotidyltransferase domain-containing protein [Muribaculaceae bacterium]|nr:nucleotidyltransferase domain-containing protein [Muribaculaceae bacterium]
MEKTNVIEHIKQIGLEVLPQNSRLFLYGSRARGNEHEGSDWDLLILLDKDSLAFKDYDLIFPFREYGWDIGEEINPHIYTIEQWNRWGFMPFHKNVEQDKHVLI